MVLPLLAAMGPAAAAGAGIGTTAAALPALAAGAGAGALPTLAAAPVLGSAGLAGAGAGASAAMGSAAPAALGAGLSKAAMPSALAAKAGMASGGLPAAAGGIGATPATAYVPQAMSTKMLANGFSPTMSKIIGGTGDKIAGAFSKLGQDPMQSLGLASKLAQMGQGGGQQQRIPAPSAGTGMNKSLSQAPQDVADNIRAEMGMVDMGRSAGLEMRGMDRRIARGGGRANARRIG